MVVTARTIPLTYYFDWHGIEDFSEYLFDEKGIPRVYYDKTIGLRYNAITTAQYGLHCLRKKEFSAAIAAAEWLLENCEPLQHGALGWVYRFDLKFYGPHAPWISAMAQGEAISLLLRAYMLEPKRRYLEVAHKAFRTFLYHIRDGGVTAAFDDGSLALEEFTATPPPHVLNGLIFALLGVYDMWQYSGENTAGEVFREANAGLKSNIHLYDNGWWTLYDLHDTNRLASRMYQEVHVRLLRILAEIAPDPLYESCAIRWAGYLSSPFCNGRWFFGKLAEKIKLARRNAQS